MDAEPNAGCRRVCFGQRCAATGLLPVRVLLGGEPIVTVEQYWTAVARLAGRGYNTL